MARPVPIGAISTGVPVEEGMRRIIPEQSPVSPVGAGLEDLGASAGQLTQQWQQHDAASYMSSTLAQLRVTAEQSLLNNSQKSPDEIAKAGGFTPAVMQDFDTAQKAALQGAPNPLARTMVQRGINEIGADLQVRALRQDAAGRVAQRTLDAQTAVNNAATAAELNPASWQNAAGEQIGLIQGMGVDPEQKVQLMHYADRQITEAAGRGYAKQDPLGTLNRLGDPNDALFAGMTPDSRAAITQYARGQLVDQKASGLVDLFRTNGQQAGTQALSAIDQDQGIPADLRDEVRARVNQGVGQLRADSRQQNVQAITQLEENIAREQVSAHDRATAWQLYHLNALDPAELADTLSHIDRVQIKQAGDQVNLAAAQAAYANSTPLDPKDKDAIDAMDALFSQQTRGIQPGSDAYANRATDIARRTGIVPASAVSWARANLVSGNTQAAAQAADLLARVQEANPRAAGFGVDEKTSAIADSISSAVRVGTAPQLAVTQAQTNANLSKADLEGLKERWAANNGQIQKDQVDALQTALNNNKDFKPSVFGNTPAIPPAMQGEFDQATRRYYDLTGGNIQQARELASRDLLHTWGVTQINGAPQIVQYAPEALFPGLTATTVRTDLEYQLTQHANALERLNPATGKLEPAKIDPTAVRFIPTDETARSGGVTWQLGAPDEFGALDVVRKADGTPLTYSIPTQRADWDAVRERAAAASLGAARQLQADRAQAEALANQADEGFLQMSKSPQSLRAR